MELRPQCQLLRLIHQQEQRSLSLEPSIQQSELPPLILMQSLSSYPLVNLSLRLTWTLVSHTELYCGVSSCSHIVTTDLSEEDKPWRRPGSDITDYFNYGFDEFTWASYCLKQDTLRKEVSDQKKQMEDMQSFLGMPGMPGPPQAAQPAMPMPAMSGMGDMPPEMQQMMATMMSQGMDPSQMDPAMFMQQMQQMQQGGQGNGPGGNQGAGFGGAGQAFGAQGPTQQQMGFGFDQGMGGDRNRGGNFAGRGRGTQNRRNW